MIFLSTAATASSASDLGKSNSVVFAFCIVTSNKDFAAGAELTVLLMMDEAEQSASCSPTPACLIGREVVWREQHSYEIFLCQPCKYHLVLKNNHCNQLDLQASIEVE